MTELQRYEKLKEKGWTYDPIKGNIISHKGKVITNKNDNGYIRFQLKNDDKVYNIYGHRFIWWFFYGELPNVIDHINRIKTDNRIDNLRSVDPQINCFNSSCKGYYYNKASKKYHAQICIGYKNIYLGLHETEQEARQAYLDAKKTHHII